MRKRFLGSAIALATALAFLLAARAQTDRSAAAKANTKSAAFDPMIFRESGIPRPSCSPKVK